MDIYFENNVIILWNKPIKSLILCHSQTFLVDHIQIAEIGAASVFLSLQESHIDS
jgi:hypothetical protein